MTVKTRIAIDPNVRIRGNATFAGLEDVEGPLHLGLMVEVFEPESDLSGIGEVVEVDAERRLVFIRVEWSSLRPRLRPMTQGQNTCVSAPGLLVLDNDDQNDVRWSGRRGGRLSAAFGGLVRVV